MARLYYLTTENSPSIHEIQEQLESVKRALDVWHDRLGHPNMETIKRLEVLSKLMEKNKTNESECVHCIQGKMRREAFPVEEGEKASLVLERIHTDIMEPIISVSHSRKKFIITFVDEVV